MKSNRNIAIIGMALFSMYFGAGSLIFPPYLGMMSGPEMFKGFLCFFISDVGLAFVTTFAIMTSARNSISDITSPIGKTSANLINVAVVTCIGPLFLIPRTCATSFSMFLTPLWPEANSWIFSLIYFTIVLFLTIRPTKVVDILGMILTPALFIGLIILITGGIINPVGPITEAARSDSVFRDGLIAGYQAMDVFCALIFTILLINTINQRGYSDPKEKARVAVKACIVAGAGLFFVYCGLTYLGATASTLYPDDVNQASLLVMITDGIFGKTAVVLLGITVVLACLTTAIGLTSSCSAYFEQDLTNGKVRYQTMVYVITAASLLFSNMGLNRIISFALPILTALYPAVLILIALSFFKIRNTNIHKGAVIGGLIVGFSSAVHTFGVDVPIINSLPLAEYGLNWIIPAAITGCIGALFKSVKPLTLDPLAEALPEVE